MAADRAVLTSPVALDSVAPEPTTSVTVILVRKGNPKSIHDWADLARPGTSVVISNPKITGNGRYTDWLALRNRLGLVTGSTVHLLPRKLTRCAAEGFDPAAMI